MNDKWTKCEICDRLTPKRGADGKEKKVCSSCMFQVLIAKKLRGVSIQEV